MGESELEEEMEKALTILKTNKLKVDPTSRPKKTRRAGLALARHVTNLNLHMTSTPHDWLSEMKLEEHWYEGGSGALAYQWNLKFEKNDNQAQQQ